MRHFIFNYLLEGDKGGHLSLSIADHATIKEWTLTYLSNIEADMASHPLYSTDKCCDSELTKVTIAEPHLHAH